MIELSYLFNRGFCNTNLLVTQSTDDSLVWYFFMIFLIVVGIVAGVLIFIYSKKPEDWEHIPIIDEYYAPGKLQYLVDSVKTMPIDYSDVSPMKEYIQIIFFEKIRASHGITVRELFKMKEKNPRKLANIIKDKEIVDFILNFESKEEKVGFGNFFKRDKIDVRKKYFGELNSVLDKMEVWGE